MSEDEQLVMYNREDLEEGQPIQFVGIHVLQWERFKRDGLMDADCDWEYAFVFEKIGENSPD